MTRSPTAAAASATAPAARFTRATGLLLAPLDLDDFFAVDRFAEAFFAEDFLADDFFAEDFLADDFFAVDFFAEDFLAVDFLAVAFFADDFRAAFFAEDFLAVAFFAEDFLAVDFFAAEAPGMRMVRRAVPLLLLLLLLLPRDAGLRVVVVPEDLERVAMNLLLVEEVCLAGKQELGTERHQRNCMTRFSRHFEDICT